MLHLEHHLKHQHKMACWQCCLSSLYNHWQVRQQLLLIFTFSSV